MAKTKVVRKKIKNKKESSISQWWSGLESDNRHKIIRRFWNSSLSIACIACVAVTLYLLQGYALKDEKSQTNNVSVRFTNAPVWIPVQLRRRISKQLVTQSSDYRDEMLSRDVYQKARSNSWISSISKVVKFRDEQDRAVVEVDCEFRRPIAIAKYGNKHCYVDGEGVRLADSMRDPQVARWETSVYDEKLSKNIRKQFVEIAHVPSGTRAWRIPYIVIELNQQFDSAMPAAGEKWQSKALTDGLKLAKMIYKRNYSNQITRIDARNYDGRISRNLEHIGFWAGRTYIKFGRFPHKDGVDWVVSPERKLSNLDRYVAYSNGKLTGANGIDLQIDTIDDSLYGSYGEGDKTIEN